MRSFLAACVAIVFIGISAALILHEVTGRSEDRSFDVLGTTHPLTERIRARS